MNKHTPGPWLSKQGSDGIDWEIDAPNGDPTLEYKTWTRFVAVYGSEDYPRKGAVVAEANARLIASAPELLAALQACDEAMEYISEYDIPITLPDQVKAAIKKALGE
jgi:hypothetical protein